MSRFFFAPMRTGGLAALPAVLSTLPLLWKTPLGHDHPAHVFKAWHFWTEMLGRGRLRGWSHFWGFGFPSDELVPSGGEIWVCLFRVLSLGQLSWLRTYALAFAAFVVFKALAAYAFTRRWFGPAPALVAAWLTSIDAGAFSEGGWVWNTEWGVWPVSLSMSLALVGFVELDRVASTGRVRDVLGAGFAFAWALLAHQVALLVLAVAIPILLVERGARADRSPVRMLQMLAGAALGVALAAFTLLPFLARSRYTMDLGVATRSLGDVFVRLLSLRTFARGSPVIDALALIGAWLALRERRPGAWFMSACAAAFVLLSSNLLTAVLHLERAFPSLIKIEAPRMLLVAKLFWFPLAGYAAVALYERAAALRLTRGSEVAVRRGLRAALIGAIIVPLLPRLYQAQIARRIQGEAETPHFADLLRAFAWSRELRERDPGHYRIAYEFGRDDHTSLLAPIYDGGPLYKIGDTPSQIFDGLPMTDGPEMLEALSVRYVVSHAPRAEAYFTHERSIGSLEVYRFDRYRAEPFELVGPGHAELVEWAPERIRLRLSGTSAESRIRIHVAAFERWRATRDGAPLPLSTVTVHGVQDPVLMEVPATDGELGLDYVDEAVDRLGWLVTLGALPVVAVFALVGHRPWARALSALARRRRKIGIGALLVSCAAVTGVVLRAKRPGALLPRHSIFHGDVELSLAGRACSKEGELAFACGPHRVAATLYHGRGDHLCMSAPEIGALRARWQARLGAFVAGRYDARGAFGWLEATLDGRGLGWAWTRPGYMRAQQVQFDVRPRTGDIASVEVALSGGVLRCFDFWMVEPPAPPEQEVSWFPSHGG